MKFVSVLFGLFFVAGSAYAELKVINFNEVADMKSIKDCATADEFKVSVPSDKLQWTHSHISPVQLCLSYLGVEPCEGKPAAAKFDLKIVDGSSTEIASVSGQGDIDISKDQVCYTFNPCKILDAIAGAEVELEKVQLEATVTVSGLAGDKKAGGFAFVLGVDVLTQGGSPFSESAEITYGGSIAIVRENADCGGGDECSYSVSNTDIFEEVLVVAYVKEGNSAPTCTKDDSATKVHYTVLTPKADKGCKVGEAACDVTLTVSNELGEAQSTEPVQDGNTTDGSNKSTTESGAFSLIPGALGLASLLFILF